ncbi:hypothetical protein K1719_031427 [Acacia pycnantha]|nr:hypothetical protein K1719_031427 [Acacia pycnantha]
MKSGGVEDGGSDPKLGGAEDGGGDPKSHGVEDAENCDLYLITCPLLSIFKFECPPQSINPEGLDVEINWCNIKDLLNMPFALVKLSCVFIIRTAFLLIYAWTELVKATDITNVTPPQQLEFHSYKLSGDSRWSSEFMSSRSSPEVHASSPNATLTETYGDNLLNPTTSHMDDNLVSEILC